MGEGERRANEKVKEMKLEGKNKIVSVIFFN
jgi:hypothetical protein